MTNDLLKPTRAKGDSTIGLGHDGKVKGVPDVPGMHGPNPARATERHARGNIALSGAPKVQHHIPVTADHRSRTSPLPGMIRSVDGSPDASSENPLDIEPKNPDSKSYSAVPHSHGMRSRVEPLLSEADHAARGRLVLAQGIVAESGGDHPVKVAMANKGSK
jgi:hypothetical protein